MSSQILTWSGLRWGTGSDEPAVRHESERLARRLGRLNLDAVTFSQGAATLERWASNAKMQRSKLLSIMVNYLGAGSSRASRAGISRAGRGLLTI